MAALNCLVFFVSMVWLLILGRWKIILIGCFAAYLFQFFYFVPSLIQIPFHSIIQKCMERDHKYSMIFLSFVSNLLINLFDFLWLLLVYLTIIKFIKGDPLPYLLFGYGVAISPFFYVVSKHNNSTGNFIFVSLTQGCFLILILSYYFSLFPYSCYFIVILLLFRYTRMEGFARSHHQIL